MSRSAARAHTGRDRTSLYREITDKIIVQLEQGRVPWVQPWGTAAAKASLTMPKNAATQRHYSGINVLILWGAVIERGFITQNWLTFRQALGLGGNVRKGEHGTTVVYADRFVPDEERRRAEHDGDEPNTIPFLKRFTVFNTDQCENLPPELTSPPVPVPEGVIPPHAEALIAATRADFRIGGDRAFYSPADDFIQVPTPDAYFEPINWHRTALHELGHWSGHHSRLGRDLSGNFGSALYAKEELVAEITSAFVCASLSIVPTVRHADYIGSWLEVLREDDRAIVRAASAASKAADYLLAFRPESNEPANTVKASDDLQASPSPAICVYPSVDLGPRAGRGPGYVDPGELAADRWNETHGDKFGELGEPELLTLFASVGQQVAARCLKSRPCLSSWALVLEYLRSQIGFEAIEHFRILFLNKRNELIADEEQQRGTVDHVPVYPREVLKRALELNATAIVLAHNHPSGDPTPSRADIAMTQEVVKACQVVGIAVHDHVIVGRQGHSSLKQLGLI